MAGNKIDDWTGRWLATWPGRCDVEYMVGQIDGWPGRWDVKCMAGQVGGWPGRWLAKKV